MQLLPALVDTLHEITNEALGRLQLDDESQIGLRGSSGVGEIDSTIDDPTPSPIFESASSALQRARLLVDGEKAQLTDAMERRTMHDLLSLLEATHRLATIEDHPPSLAIALSDVLAAISATHDQHCRCAD